MASATASRRIPEQEWARHEKTIRRLYLDQDKGLQEVMEKMARDHNFHASKSQYETRFKKWDITKNRKRTEWKSLALHLQRREAAGKKSSVFINGNLVPEARIKRELAYLGGRRSHGNAGSRLVSSPPLPPGFRIKTPPPERLVDSELPASQLIEGIRSNNDLQISFVFPLSTPMCIDPRLTLIPEQGLPSEDNISPNSSSTPQGRRPFVPIVLPKAVLLSFLPPALVALSSRVNYPVGEASEDRSTSLLEPQALSLPYSRLIIFQLINGFIRMSGLSLPDVWRFLKENAKNNLHSFFQRLPKHESKVVAEKAFHCAIEAGDAGGVEFFIDSFNMRTQLDDMICRRLDGADFTPLQLAVGLRHVSVVRVLLECGADPNKYSSALGQIAAREFGIVSDFPDGMQLVDLLLSYGAVVTSDHLFHATSIRDQNLFVRLFRASSLNNQISSVSGGVIHEVVRFFDEEGVLKLFDELTEPQIVEALKTSHEPFGSLLNWVVQRSHIRLTQRLVLEQGFEITAKTLFAASSAAQTATLRWLLENSAYSDGSLPSIREAYVGGIISGNGDVLKLLEDYGALRYISMVDYTISSGIYEAAFAMGNFDIAKRLLGLRPPCSPLVLGAGLFKAVQLRDYGMSRWLLDLGADPNQTAFNKNGHRADTTLSSALQARNKRLVRMLLSSPNIFLSSPPFTAMIEAVEWGDRDIVTELVLAGSPLNAPTKSLTPLIAAIIKKDRAMIETLLRFGASVNFSVAIELGTPSPFPTGQWMSLDDNFILSRRKSLTPLTAAIIIGDTEQILFLISQGADPADSTALTEAYLGKLEEAIDVILQQYRRRYPSGRAGFGYEVMRRVIKDGNLSLMSQLLAHGIRFPTLSSLRDALTLETDDMYQTPLVDAIVRGDEIGFAIFRMILDADQGNARYLDAVIRWTMVYQSETALLIAIRARQLDKVRLLVDRGANINAQPTRGICRTPLQAAAGTGDFKIVEFLVQSGAEVNSPAAGVRGGTALQFACIYGYAGIVDFLLRSGADVNAMPAWGGMTALEAAAEYGRFDTAVMLLNAGASFDGNFRPYLLRAVQRARERGHLGVADLLASRDPALRQEREVAAGSTSVETPVAGHNSDDRFPIDQFIDWEMGEGMI